MSGFAPSSSRWLAAAGLVLAAGCVDHETVAPMTTSLDVTVTQPTSLGSETSRLADSVRQVTVSVKALDEQGQTDASFSAPVDVSVHTLGTLTKTATKVELKNGEGTATVTIPVAFGKSYLWIEDAAASMTREPTYATGTSPTLWYREPTIYDISTPDSRGSTTSQLRFSVLSGKQVRVTNSRFDTRGQLLVTGVFADGFSLSDVNCETKPCVASPYGHVYVFSFGRPVDVKGRAVSVGQTLKWVEGGVAEFNGFTELNFPSEEIDDATGDATMVPEPVVIDKEWLRSGGPMQNLLKMEEQEAGLMAVTGVTVCQLDEDYSQYKQWKVNIGLGCGAAVNIITAGTVSTFNPAQYVGKTLPKVIGILKTVNLGSFNVWILLPRTTADLVLPT